MFIMCISLSFPVAVNSVIHHFEASKVSGFHSINALGYSYVDGVMTHVNINSVAIYPSQLVINGRLVNLFT